MKSKIKHFYITMMIAIVAFGGVMTGCGASEEKTLLETENVVVTRLGRDTSVEDVQAGKIYNFTLKRVENGTRNSHKATKSNESEYLKVTIAGKTLIVEDKETGETYYF